VVDILEGECCVIIILTVEALASLLWRVRGS
jgi:hypothetical protein